MTKEPSTSRLHSAPPSHSIGDAIHVWNVHALIAQALEHAQGFQIIANALRAIAKMTRTQLAVFAQAFDDAPAWSKSSRLRACS